MATRKQPSFYVYRIFEGHETVYVGKGSGRRLQSQMSKFRLPGEILEACKSDDHAFEREVHWIATLYPTSNRVAGGNGGRCRPKRVARLPKEYAMIEQVGSRRYVARFLMSKLNDANCDRFGVSKVELNRVREIADGPRL